MLVGRTVVEPGGCLHWLTLLIEVGKLTETLFGWRHNKHRNGPTVPFVTIGIQVDRTPYRRSAGVTPTRPELGLAAAAQRLRRRPGRPRKRPIPAPSSSGLPGPADRHGPDKMRANPPIRHGQDEGGKAHKARPLRPSWAPHAAVG